MQILAALIILSALGSLFTEDNLSLKGIDLHKIDGILLPRTKITEKFIYLTHNNLQKLSKILCRLCLDFNWELEFTNQT